MSQKEIREAKILIAETIETIYNSIDINKSNEFKNSVIVNELMRQKRVNNSYCLDYWYVIDLFLSTLIKKYISIYL